MIGNTINIQPLVGLANSIKAMRDARRISLSKPEYIGISYFDGGGENTVVGNYKCDYCDSRYKVFVTNCKNCGGTVK